jgi:peptidyl-tRNA hydrolase, PTH1 family
VRVIAGLGNPGDEYRNSRHNAGFLVVAGLARAHRIKLAVGSGDFMSGTGRVAGQRVLLVQPHSYMNESGPALASALSEADAAASDLIVVCDDVNLPLGQLRLRLSGSDGGHRGLRSIVGTLGTDAFARLRLGVGAPPVGADTADYVLDEFAESERDAVRDMVAKAVEAVEVSLALGFERAMSVYNRRERPEDAREPGEGS